MHGSLLLLSFLSSPRILNTPVHSGLPSYSIYPLPTLSESFQSFSLSLSSPLVGPCATTHTLSLANLNFIHSTLVFIHQNSVTEKLPPFLGLSFSCTSTQIPHILHHEISPFPLILLSLPQSIYKAVGGKDSRPFWGQCSHHLVSSLFLFSIPFFIPHELIKSAR